MSELKQSSVALLEKAIDDKIKKAKSKQGTTLATVTRIDNDGTTWVHVYGGADETPVRHMTSSASVGDVINVTFSGLSCSGVGNVSSPSATQKQVQQLSSETASAIKGVMGGVLQIKTLVAEKVATKELDAEIANILTASIQNATISTLNAMYADINAANINTAEIQDAWVDKLLVQTNLLANDGTVFTLDAVQVDAANITTGTLDVRRLIITREETDPETGELVEQKYLVNIDPETSQPTYEKLDGNIVEPRSIGADKIEAHAITAEELTIQNIVGTGGWINLANGTFAYGNPLTGQGITWDGSSLNISGSVRIGSSSKALSDMLTADDVTVTQNQTQTGYDVDIAGNTFSLVNGEDGQPGATGPQGPQGQTGPTAQWYYGTALTHTSGTATLATSSTAGVVVGAMYLNKSTSLCYKCTAISGTTATWTYVGNLTEGVIDNINVGGRNLLLNTASMTNCWQLQPGSMTSVTDGVVSCTSNDTSNYMLFVPVSPGDVLTLSVDVKASAAKTYTKNGSYFILFGYFEVDSTNYNTANRVDYALGDGAVTTSWKHFEYTVTVPSSSSIHYVGIGFRNNVSSPPTLYFRRPKLEYGNIATDWTPAPEDIQATANSRAQRIYYRTASESSAPSAGPTTWVTTANDVYDTWTTKLPPMAATTDSGSTKYPHLYTCVQYQSVAQNAAGTTCTCSAVLKDDSITVVDGNMLVTGSVTASKLDTIDLNASHAITIGAFDYETSNTITDAAANASQALQDASDAAKTATNFITESGENDMLLTAGPQAYRVRLTSSGMEILNPDGDVVGFHGATIQLGSTDGIYFEASETRLAFRTLTQEIAYFGLNSDGIWQMHIATTYVDDMIRFGDYAWIKRDNGNMSIKWLGE